MGQLRSAKSLAVIGVLVASLAAVPAGASAATKLNALERSQNRKLSNDGRALKTAATAIGTLSGRLNSGLGATNANLGATNGSVSVLSAKLTDTTNRLDALLTAAAPIPGDLTQLAAGLTAAGAGLTTVGAGLVTLQHVTTSQTHIAAQVFTNAPGPGTAVRGCFVTTPPLPFDGNQAVTTMTCPVIQVQTDPAGGPENAPAAGGPINVQADCRSNKTNVTGSAPCGLAGIVSLTVNQSPAGGFAGTFPAPTSFLATTPNAALGGGPLVVIPNSVPIPDLTGAGGTNNPAAPLSFTSNDAPANQVNLTNTAASGGDAATFPPGVRPSLPTCTGGATPCVSTINITLRGVDSNPETS
jgi:hypothetical protein